MMQALIVKLLVSSFLSILAKIATPDIFEEALTAIVMKGARKLADITENTVDDELVNIIEKALKKQKESDEASNG